MMLSNINSWNKNLTSRLLIKHVLQPKKSQCIVNLRILSAPQGSSGLLMVRTVTKWLVVLCTESLIQSPLETVENKLLAFIKRYWFVVHRMNILECVGQVEICFSLWRKCYNEVRVFQLICSQFGIVILPYFFHTFLPNVQTSELVHSVHQYCYVLCRVVLYKG